MSGTSPSPAAAFSSTAFSDQEKADIRLFCGFETYGGEGDAGFQGWRYYQEYGLLEFRMNNLAPAEYQNVRLMLSYLYPIRTAMAAMYATINVAIAASFTRNSSELVDRQQQYTEMRKQLCGAVGIVPGPLLRGGGSVRIRA